MTGTVLQSTLGNETELACYTANNTDLLQCSLSDMGGATGGEGLFGVLVAGALMYTFYVASDGGLATPSVLTALTGGVMIPVLPPAYRTIALTVVFLGLVAALLTGLKKYVMSTGI
jgi:hypothetical protein